MVETQHWHVKTAKRACLKELNIKTRTRCVHFRSPWKTWALLPTPTPAVLSTERHTQPQSKHQDWERKILFLSAKRGGADLFTSCLMQYGECNHRCGKWVLFRTAGQGSISCSLVSRQGAMSTLIRSVCGTRTHVYGLWTLQNHCLSHTAVSIQHVHLIYHW